MEVEKNRIKQGLLCNFSEPVNQIAVQRAVIISKVARMDCPKEWPELFPTLLQAVESPDMLIQHRSLLTLYHVIKAISSKRLAGEECVRLPDCKFVYLIINFRRQKTVLRFHYKYFCFYF